ncbi:MAG TPA: hypothetical protein PLW02_10635, partial [Verrucomicrobiota bacterium]|nr:hypothetical protein [Verrucomicrobiota bacterium]
QDGQDISKSAKAGDRIIAKAMQKHHKPPKAVTEPLDFYYQWLRLNCGSFTSCKVLFYFNFYAIILPLLAKFHNASLRLVDIYR